MRLRFKCEFLEVEIQLIEIFGHPENKVKEAACKALLQGLFRRIWLRALSSATQLCIYGLIINAKLLTDHDVTQVRADLKRPCQAGIDRPFISAIP